MSLSNKPIDTIHSLLAGYFKLNEFAGTRKNSIVGRFPLSFKQFGESSTITGNVDEGIRDSCVNMFARGAQLVSAEPIAIDQAFSLAFWFRNYEEKERGIFEQKFNYQQLTQTLSEYIFPELSVTAIGSNVVVKYAAKKSQYETKLDAELNSSTYKLEPGKWTFVVIRCAGEIAPLELIIKQPATKANILLQSNSETQGTLPYISAKARARVFQSSVVERINSTSGPFVLGSKVGLDGSVTNLDEFGIWRKRISDAEVDLLYNNGFGNTYPFEEPIVLTNLPKSLNALMSPDHFCFDVDTAITESATDSSNGLSFKLPIFSDIRESGGKLSSTTGLSYDFTVDWGDSKKETFKKIASSVNKDTYLSHQYKVPGIYTIQIKENTKGGFPSIHFNNEVDSKKVINLRQWGTNLWYTMESAFYGCSNMKLSAGDSPNVDKVLNFKNCFRECKSITHFKRINFKSATDLSGAWKDCSNLISFDWCYFPYTSQYELLQVNFNEAWMNCNLLGKHLSFPQNIPSKTTWRTSKSDYQVNTLLFQAASNMNNTFDGTSIKTNDLIKIFEVFRLKHLDDGVNQIVFNNNVQWVNNGPLLRLNTSYRQLMRDLRSKYNWTLQNIGTI